MGKLGVLGDLGSLDMLRGIRSSLRENSNSIVEERWASLGSIAESILEACDSRDLGALARASRALKNKMRRPSVRKALAEEDMKPSDEGGEDNGEDMKPGDEGETSDKRVQKRRKVLDKLDKNKKFPSKDSKDSKDSKCRCANCNAEIGDDISKCIEGTLCTKCALKGKKNVQKQEAEKEARKGAVKAGGVMGGMPPGGGMESVEQVESSNLGMNVSSLRRRYY